MHTVELYRKVRLACRDGMSERAAARHFGVSRQSVRKMLQFSVPPGYRRTAPVRRPKLDEFTGLIEQWLEDDRRHAIQHVPDSGAPAGDRALKSIWRIRRWTRLRLTVWPRSSNSFTHTPAAVERQLEMDLVDEPRHRQGPPR